MGADILLDHHAIIHRRLSSGDRTVMLPPHRNGILALHVSPDGQSRLVVDGLGVVWLESLPSGAVVRTFKAASGSYTDALYWPPEGNQLLLAGSNFVDVVTLPYGGRDRPAPGIRWTASS